MRLARLVAAGLVAGVVAGFVVALLRPDRAAPRPDTGAAVAPPAGADAGLDVGAPDEVVVDVRTRRSVNG
jgi:hypothetical protein